MRFPFQSNSIWNTGIGSNVIYSKNTDPDVQMLHSGTGCNFHTSTYSNSVSFGTAQHPLVTIVSGDSNPAYNFGSIRMRVDPASRPCPPDNHWTFYDYTQRAACSVYKAVFPASGIVNGAVITCTLGQVFDVCGDGNSALTLPGYPTVQNNRYDFWKGIITLEDVMSGQIAHMLRYSTDPRISKPGSYVRGGYETNMFWPTPMLDYFSYETYTGTFPAGCTIGIPMSVDLTQQGLTPAGQMVGGALRSRGALWMDSNGNGCGAFYGDTRLAGTTFAAQLNADANKLFSLCQIIRNQGLSSVNGGGQYNHWAIPPIAPQFMALPMFAYN